MSFRKYISLKPVNRLTKTGLTKNEKLKKPKPVGFTKIKKPVDRFSVSVLNTLFTTQELVKDFDLL